MSPYSIVTLEEVVGFIDSLDRIRKARIDRFYYLFETYGQFLPAKYLKKLTSNLWELRPGDVQLFLTIRGRIGYVVHAIRKKTQKTPKKDIDLGLQRIKQII